MATTEPQQEIPESSPDAIITQQNTEDEAAHRQSIEIDAKGGVADDDDGDTAVTTESILPPVTPAILEEYEKEQALKRKMETRKGMERLKNSKMGCFGIPSCLMLVMVFLVLAVIAGTIAAVLLYNESEGVQPPSDSPTVMATSDTPS